jgi:hypothetical protein
VIRTRHSPALAFALATAGLAACGGGDSSIGGAVSGLGTGFSLIVQDNNGDNLTLSANGSFQFPAAIAPLGSYDVTVLSQPVGQSCQVFNGSGAVDAAGDPVNTVVINCADTTSVAGTVSGLRPGTSVTLSDGYVLLPIASSGAFAFPELLTPGTTYNVTVTTPPVGETCTVTNGSGIVVANVIAMVTVACN